jgi:hypothetical protein
VPEAQLRRRIQDSRDSAAVRSAAVRSAAVRSAAVRSAAVCAAAVCAAAVHPALRPPDSPRSVAGRQREPSIPLSAPPSAAQRSPTACGWGLTKRRPSPFALVAALAKQGRSSSIGRILPFRSVRLPASRNPTVPTAPPPPTAEPHALSASIEESFRRVYRAKGEPLKTLNKKNGFCVSDAKKMAVALRMVIVFRQSFAALRSRSCW